MPLPLPPRNPSRNTGAGRPQPSEASSSSPPADASATSAVLGASTAKVAASSYVYVAKIQMAGSTLAGWCFFTHETRYTQEQFQTCVKEACRNAEESRIAWRRKEMAKNKTPVPNAREMNERLFPSDVSFVEAVMADRWKFKVLKVQPGQGEIEPTVKVNS